MTSATPERSSKLPRSISPGLPVMPTAVRWAPGSGWARKPNCSIWSQTAWISSGVACAFMTTNIALPQTISLTFETAESNSCWADEPSNWIHLFPRKTETLCNNADLGAIPTAQPEPSVALFCRGSIAGLGGDQCGSKNHTDKGETDQNVMHCAS